MNRLGMPTMMSICTKMKTNRVRYQPLTTPQVVIILIISLHLCGLNNNMKPNSTEDCWTLQQTHKTKEERQIFLVFLIFKNKNQKGRTSKAKSFWFFRIVQIKQKGKSKPRQKEAKRKQRETTEIFLVFCVLESKSKERTKTNKRTKHEYTKYRRKMIWRCVWCRCTSPQA